MHNRLNNSQRQLKAAAMIKKSLVEIFQIGKGLNPYFIDNNITISEISISGDLRNVTCYVLPFGLAKIEPNELIKLLNSLKNTIRALLTKKINLKYSPELIFRYDSSYDQAFKIDKLIRQSQTNQNDGQ